MKLEFGYFCFVLFFCEFVWARGRSCWSWVFCFQQAKSALGSFTFLEDLISDKLKFSRQPNGSLRLLGFKVPLSSGNLRIMALETDGFMMKGKSFCGWQKNAWMDVLNL